MTPRAVIGFVTLLHGLTPKLGVLVMNVRVLYFRNCSRSHSLYLSGAERLQDHHPGLRGRYRCVSVWSRRRLHATHTGLYQLGWAVLAGHTRVADPHANFRNAFAGSSHSSNDVNISFFLFNPVTHVGHIVRNCHF